VNWWRAAQGAVLCGLLALSGCGWFSHAPEKAAQACPGAVVLRPLKNTATFGPGPEPRPDNVAFYGLLDEVDATCSYNPGSVLVKLDVIVIGQRGALATGNAVDLDYFVAVTAPPQTILSKKPFAVRVVFPAGKIRAGVTDHIDLAIPLEGRQGSDLTLYVGFQQSPEVVEFYKRFRGR
jgi:hypothetical protein